MNGISRIAGGLSLAIAAVGGVTAQAEWYYVEQQPTIVVNRPVVVEQVPYVVQQQVVVQQPVVVSRKVVVSRPVVVSRQVQVQPVYADPCCDEPVPVSRPVIVSRHPVVTQPYAVREEVDVRRDGRVEYEQKGKFQAFDGRRLKTYRYKYEVDERRSGTRYKFDIDD